jgi:predicted DNA binding CopG/RHH family protein
MPSTRKPKDKSINLRLSGELYNAVRKRAGAARAGFPIPREPRACQRGIIVL